MRRDLSGALPPLAFLAIFYGGQWLLGINVPQHLALSSEVVLGLLVLAGMFIGLIVHELGHALAVRWAGERVLTVTLGGKLLATTFHVGAVPVSVGLGLGGSVSCRTHQLTAGQRAAIAAAGPAANVLVAPLCLLLPVPHWEAAYLAIALFASALQDLAPAHRAGGVQSDGVMLFQTPARLRAGAAELDRAKAA